VQDLKLDKRLNYMENINLVPTPNFLRHYDIRGISDKRIMSKVVSFVSC
jgi:hypothetical protein